MILDHPITHSAQQFICENQAEANDDVGTVTRGLVTHRDFFEKRWGISLQDSDYKCQIDAGNDDGAFSLNSDTGALKIVDPSKFTQTRTLTIKVWPDPYTWYFELTECEILLLSDIYYIDPTYTGTSTGSKTQPFKSYAANVYGGAGWGLASIPGKAFLWKRGTTAQNEWTVTNTGTNESTAPIRFGSYGAGANVVIDLSLNATSERFAQVGLASMSGPAEDFKMANNIFYYDFEITHDRSSIVYPVQVVPMGRFIEFHRLKMTNCTFKEGFIWLAGPTNYPSVDRKIVLKDIFTYEHGIDTVAGGQGDWPRAIKLETGGVTCHNIYCETSKNYHTSAYSGGSTHPITESKFCKIVINTKLNPDLFAMQVRGAQQTYEWCVIDGVDYGLTIFGQTTTNGNIPDNTSIFDNIILKNIGKFSLTSINQTSLNMDGAQVKRVFDSGDAKPIIIYGGDKCINTKFYNIFLNPNASGSGIQIGTQLSTNGNGVTVIDSCLVHVIGNYDSQTIVRNSIYNAIVEDQPATKITNITPISSGVYKNANYEPTADAPQIAAGTAGGVTLDLLGYLRPSPPSIGPYEFNSQTLNAPVISNLWRYNRLVNGAVFWGDEIYNAYQATKNGGGEFGVSLAAVRTIRQKINLSDWDLLSIPFGNVGSALTSLVGPALSVAGGGNGSRFDKNGLLITELPNDRPRYTFNPETGIFEGVYLEVESENIRTHSENFNNWDKVAIGVGEVPIITPNFSLIYGVDSDKVLFERSGDDFLEGGRIATNLSLTNGDLVMHKMLLKSLSGSQEVQLYVAGFRTDQLMISENVLEIKQEFTLNVPSSSFASGLSQRGDDITTSGEFLLRYSQVEIGKDTSYIKTTDTPVTRPADVYTAAGVINQSANHLKFYIINGVKIAEYFDFALGQLKTYISGALISTAPHTPGPDLVVSSAGSDKLEAVGYKAATFTDQELINLTS